MKTIRLFFFGATAMLFVLVACQRNSQGELLPRNPVQGEPQNTTSVARESHSSGTGTPVSYNVVLESRNFVDGNWEWIWSVENPNPGNGNNGTVQNLSHWGMIVEFDFTSVIGAAYSADGSNWTTFTPSLEIDPSQICVTEPVLKFNYGTTGTARSFYKLIISEDYPESEDNSSPGYYKSGANTGCSTILFKGVNSGDVTIR